MTEHELRAMIPTLQRDIDLIDTEMFTTPSITRFGSLTYERIGKISLLTKISSVLSPIKALPFEMLSEIFSHCVSGPVDLSLWESNVLESWSISQVCSRWRDVALQTPSLWNNIAVMFRGSRRRNWDCLIHLTEIYLSRTRHSLISLRIVASPSRGPLAAISRHGLTTLIQPYLGQLRHLSLQPAEAFKDLLWLPCGRVNALETVSLSFERGIYGLPLTMSESPLTLFDAASSLRMAHLSTLSADLCICLPWAQITHLDFTGSSFTPQKYHTMIRQCTNLISCTCGMVRQREAPYAIPPTVLKNLEVAIFAGDNNTAYAHFLRPFILPSIRQLEVSFVYDAGQPGDDEVLLIKRSSCVLKRLVIKDFGPDRAFELLAELPSLTELRLSTGSLGNIVFRELLRSIACGDLVPNLHRFECDLSAASFILHILDARMKPRHPPHLPYTAIQTLVIHGNPNKARGLIKASLSTLSTLGMDILILPHSEESPGVFFV